MIQNDDILNMNFYKKEKFTGSYQGMRYLIQKDQEEDAEDENVKHDIFRVTIWPGPYNFASTADDLKSSAVFPFTPEGKEQVVGWLNAVSYTHLLYGLSNRSVCCTVVC